MNSGNTGTWPQLGHDIRSSSGYRTREFVRRRVRWRPVPTWIAVALLVVGYGLMFAGLLL